ncbi:MAG TPA: ParA family protein [Beijerinckiaceae bacterium]|nr:ParA family protein [Beijerinckiaceae bacterium]
MSEQGHPHVIALASPKGGGGKSTLSILLAGEFAHDGLHVLILDADPQGSVLQWERYSKANGAHITGITVESATSPEALGARLNKPGAEHIVLIDLQGTANQLFPVAASFASLVVIPTRTSMLDCSQTAATVDLLKALAGRGSVAPHRVLFNAVDGIEANTEPFKKAVSFILERKIPVLNTVVRQRSTYKRVTDGGGTLYELPGAETTLKPARENIRLLAHEIANLLS